jgi:hypothetical protein
VLLGFAACQESEEDLYLDKMWAWHSLEGFAFTSESRAAMLTELEAIDPPPGSHGAHMALTAAYRALIFAERTEDLLQRIERWRFMRAGSDEVPSCDVRQYLNVSSEYVSACLTEEAAHASWVQQSLLWEYNYLKERYFGYDLWEDASRLSEKGSIETDAAAMLHELTQVARMHR